MKKSNKINIITLGCSKNLVDSERLSYQLNAKGFDVSYDQEKPNGGIVIVNTCGFIGDAKEESINTILELGELKKRHKIEKLLVMGCLSERYRKDLEAEMPEVDKYYGKFDWQQIMLDLGKSYDPGLELRRDLSTPGHYAYLKIAEGCNRHCSYCAIPLITGPYQSKPIEKIVEEATILAEGGVKELQVIAQDLSYYGVDLYKEMKLAELVDKLSDIKGIEWIRLHYAYPAQFPLDVLDVMREKPNVCKYLDIALQHISDNMLAKMRRHVNKQQTMDLVRELREKVPGIHLRTTLLTGHPGETEQDFEELKEFVRWARFERMGVFAYSDEDGTYANKNYKDDIPFETKQKRVDELMEIQQGISEQVNEAKIGQSLKVMVDREEADYFVGRTEYDSPEVDPEVLIEKTGSGAGLKPGTMVKAKITGCEEFDLYAKVEE